MSRTLGYMTCVMTGILLLGGCTTTGPRPNTEPQPQALILILSSELAEKIVIDKRCKRDPDTTILLVEITVRNLTRDPLELECRTLFKDAEGLTVETSPWRLITLPPSARANHSIPTMQPHTMRMLTQIRHAE